MTEPTPTPEQNLPLVTFAVFAFNHEKYIREAVEGAFSQTYEPLEIILSDDCSSDRTFEIMQEMAAAYDGPHDVKVRQNEVNQGTLGHVLTVSSHAQGELIVVAAGDDVSIPDRACTLAEEFQKTGATIIFSQVKGITSETVDQENLTFTCPFTGRIREFGLGASAAYDTSFFRSIPFPNGAVLHEDVLFASIAYLAGMELTWVKKPLVNYRERTTVLHSSGNLLKNIRLTKAELKLRAHRINFYIKLLQYCIVNLQSLIDIFSKEFSMNADQIASHLRNRIKHYEVLQRFHKSGIISGLTRLDGIDRYNRPEIIRVFLGPSFFAVIKGTYVTVKR